VLTQDRDAKFGEMSREQFLGAALREEELVVFKGFDSDPARDAQPPHNSADLPGDGAAPRVSVEARFFAFFE
jgi:hypothetical protein